MEQGLDEVITKERPADRLLRPTTSAEQAAWLQRERRQQAARRELEDSEFDALLPPAPAEGEPEDVGDAPTTRQETDEEYATRLTEWEQKNTKVWTTLIQACDGEAFSIVEDVDTGEGKAAWEALVHRYGSATVNSQFLSLKAFMYQKQTLPIAQHVTTFKKQLRDVRAMGMKLDGAMVATVFLNSLNSSFNQFVSNAMLNSNLDVQKLYLAAVEHGLAKLATSDEAKRTKNLAMECGEKCRFGSGCRDWRRGKCDKFHPAPESKDNGGQSNGNQGNQGKRKRNTIDRGQSWECSCGTSNFNTRKKCRDCGKAPTSGGRPTHKRGKGRHEARVATLLEQQKKAQATIDELGLNIDLGFGDDDGTPVEEAMYVEEKDDREEALSVGRGTKRLRFTVDSGATKHFVNAHVPLEDRQSHQSSAVAAGGREYAITEKGTCAGETADGSTITFEALRCNAFTKNLFSVHEAAKNGTRTVFDWDHSYLENTTTGERTPLQRTRNGWELQLAQEAA